MIQEKELKEFTFDCIDKAVQSSISKLSIKNGDFSLTIETNSKAASDGKVSVQTSSDKSLPQPEEAQDTSVTVKAPLVGTFYISAVPDNPPIVQPGDRVKKGQQLCIIEAMKIMNSIESPCDGIIHRIMAADGDLVEFHQPLFVIKEDK